MERIADVMARKYPQFNTAVPHCLVSDALYQMSCQNVDYLIISENEKFQGIISDHDIASRILTENRPLNKISVREFMSRSLPVAPPDISVEQCMQLMERYSVRHIAIFEKFDFRGVVSLKDLMQEALQQGVAFHEEMPARTGYPWNY